MTTLAVMQPYIFPYLPYFQLISSADTFVFYDDVNFIKKGWINRNSILSNGAATRFTIPLSGASQNKLINEIELSDFSAWKNKFENSLQHAYSRAPQFEPAMEVINDGLQPSTNLISDLTIQSIRSVCEYLGIKTTLKVGSELNYDRTLNGQDRMLAVCEELGASKYINPVNGRDLYERAKFDDKGIELKFLKTRNVQYEQTGIPIFVPHLSIIDVLMFNDLDAIRQMLAEYDLAE